MSPGKYGHAASEGRQKAVVWSDKMNEYLIDALLHQKAIGNWSDGRFFPMAYDDILNGIRDRFGVEIDRGNIKNRLKSIKEMLNECRNLFGEDSQIKWSPMSKRFITDQHVWRELIKRKPEAKKWMTKTIDHYDRLMELFGKDREKRPAFENAESTPKKKVRKESPKKHQLIPNGLDFTVANGSDMIVNGNKALDQVVIKQNISGELDLSELCRTDTGITAIPVCANACGKGLPYAPENWPCPGDQWHWRVGSRTNSGGHWADRYLTPPSRFRVATGRKTAFTSRLQVEEFIKREFPSVDPSTFFSMFTWKIPAEGHGVQKGTQQLILPEPETVVTDPAGPCKAMNSLCHLEREGFIESSPTQACDVCCTEPGFCRECCCILCRKTIDYYSFGGCSYIKCEAVVEENYICGHVAHLDCALRCYMAGTVGGCTGLDVQYHCRRCDKKTNLMMLMEKLMETCRSLKSRGEIEPILNLGLCILRGSKQTRAKSLENFMVSAMAKLRSGVDILEVWNMGHHECWATFNAGESSVPANGVTILGAQQVPEEAVLPGNPDLRDPPVDNKLEIADENLPVHISGDHTAISAKFEDDIDFALQELLGAQQAPEEAVHSGHHDLIDPLVHNKLDMAAENLPVCITGDHNAMSAKFEADIDLALQELKKSQEAEYKLAEEKLHSQKDHILSMYSQLESQRAELANTSPISNISTYGAVLSNVLNRVDQVKREEEKFKTMLKVAGGFGKAPKRVTQKLFGLPADN